VAVVALLAGLALWFAPVATAQAAAEDAVNTCGCGRDLTGACFCQKVARCGCPGECEPKGCEEKRAKQLEREIMAETKRAAEEDRKRNAVPATRATRATSATKIDDGGRASERAKTNEASRSKSGMQFEAASATAPVARAGGPAAKRLTQSQKRELAHLLDAYLAENPERRVRTIEQLRNDLE
jgi:hypothetical protein